MARKLLKARDATAELLASLNRIKLDPIEKLSRALNMAEADGDYKEMMNGALGLMPYVYPKLKESTIKADIDQNVTGSGVTLNVTVGGNKVVGDEEEGDVEAVVTAEANDES